MNEVESIEVMMSEAARRFGLDYASLREATRMGLTPFRRQPGSPKGPWVATIAEIQTWRTSENFGRIVKVKP